MRVKFGVCDHWDVTVREPTRDELVKAIAELREEVARLKEEIRHLRRDSHEVPPHYL